MSGYGRELRGYAAALRRRASILATVALIGAAGGVGYVVTQPAPLTSTALVLLPTPALAESSSSDVDTQVRIALSASILGRAGDTLKPTLSARQVSRMVKVSGATTQLIQIQATSADGLQAQALTQAVADGYVNYVRDTAKEVTSAALADLRNRRDDLQSQFDLLEKQINATVKRQQTVDPESADGRTEAQLLAGLQTQQSAAAIQLEKVENQLAAGTPVGSSATGTLVIQAATVADGPNTALRLLAAVPLGALVGALLAGAVVLAIARRDPRIRLLNDIADAIGSPVMAAIRSRPQKSAAGWATLLETYKVTPVEAWALRHVFRGLVPSKGQTRVAGAVDHPRSLSVMSLSGDPRGLALGPQLAAFAASQGILTRVVPTVGHDRAPTLWACLTEHTNPARSNLFLGSGADDEAVDLTIFVGVIERTLPYLKIAPPSAAMLLAVGAGTATEQDLARVAVAMDDAGRHIDGIIVADPDESDRTSGRHTMAERSRLAALPTRLTGIRSAEPGKEDTPRSMP